MWARELVQEVNHPIPRYFYCYGWWIVCNSDQAREVRTELSQVEAPRSLFLDVRLDKGGPSFLLSFLRLIRPDLPFDYIVQADLEHLLLEIKCLPPEREWGSYASYDDDLRHAFEESGAWWGTPPQGGGTLCMTLDSKSRKQLRHSTLSALRLAAYCGSRLNWNLIVLDRFNLIESFPNLLSLGSGIREFLFKERILDFTIPKTPTWEEREAMISEAAYFRAARRGFTGGSPLEDWLAAEAEIDANLGL